MRQWRVLVPRLFGRQASSPGRNVRVRFTGASPANAAEELIQRIAEGHQSVSLQWLEGQIANALFYADLKEGAWVFDMGVQAPAPLRQEAAQVVADMRAEFGILEENQGTPEGWRSGVDPPVPGDHGNHVELGV